MPARRTPASMALTRRTGTDKLTDAARQHASFSKRRKGLFSKADALSKHTSARFAIIVFSETGRLYCHGYPSVICDFLHCKGNATLPLGEWADWVKKEGDSCATEEDFRSLIEKCEAVVNCVRQKLEVRRQQIGMAELTNPAQFLRSLKTLFKKASALCGLAGARIAIIVFSVTGEVTGEAYPSSGLSIVDIISNYLFRTGDALPPMGLREWLNRVGKRYQSCATEEFHSLIENCEAALPWVHKRLKDSGVKVDCDTEVLDKDFRSALESSGDGDEFNPDDFLNLSEDSIGYGDPDRFLTLPENSAGNSPSVKAGGAGGDSRVRVDCDSEVMSDNEIESILERFKDSNPSLSLLSKDYDSDRGGFLTPLVDLPAGGGRSGVDSTHTCSDLEGPEFDLDELLGDFETLPENPAVGDGSQKFDLDDFIEDLSNSPENPAVHGGSSVEEFDHGIFDGLEDLDGVYPELKI